LSFDDAYLLAEFYVTKYPKIKELLSKRFPLVIIDEMQDTDEHQLALLNLIFDPASQVIQRIGDYNQAIYNKVTEQSVWNVGVHTLPLTDSRRFSNGIALQIDRICVTPRNMNGNAAIADIPSRIILFPQQRINDVLSHFGNLLIEANIPSLSKKPAKAVGWVKETEAAAGQIRNCIQAYWAGYSLVNRVARKEFPNLNEYLVKPEAGIIETKGTSYYWDVILQILLKSLRILNLRHASGSYYSKTSLVSKLKLHPAFFELFQTAIIQWIRQIHLNQNPFAAVRTFINDQFLPLFNIASDAELNSFLNNQNPPSIVVAPNQQDAGNIFKHTYNGLDPGYADKQVEIPVCTIHSVKGETHSATLYLETFYFEEDIKKIRQYLKIGAGAGIPATQVRMIQTLKMAYVAMSRPIHLLCLAIRNDGLTQQDINELQAVGWTIDDYLCH
jgi:DNA helicase-2/ATP-dependent DNA helicase PcrA